MFTPSSFQICCDSQVNTGQIPQPHARYRLQKGLRILSLVLKSRFRNRRYDILIHLCTFCKPTVYWPAALTGTKHMFFAKQIKHLGCGVCNIMYIALWWYLLYNQLKINEEIPMYLATPMRKIYPRLLLPIPRFYASHP